MLKLFSRDAAHPLADAKELKRVLAELPVKDEVRSLDELSGWLESLMNSDGLTPAQLFEAVRQVDEAAQIFIRHLTRNYLAPSARSHSENQKLWKLCYDFWENVANAYQRVIGAYQSAETEKGKAKLAEVIKPHLPLVLSRQAAAMIACAKWLRFNHEPLPSGGWARMGRNFLFAEARKIDSEAVTLYPQGQITTTPRREYIKAIALGASSLDSLQAVQIEVAEKLVAVFSPQFVLSRQNRNDNVYWVDALLDQWPQRLARLPKDTPGVRLLAFGEVPASLAAATHQVERGELPASLNLGGQYTPKLVLSVLRHLATYWTAKPPVRKHQRHTVKNRIHVEHGFEACYQRMQGRAGAELDVELDFRAPLEAWEIGDVSLGGFGVSVSGPRKDWLKIGALLAMQPDEGGKWLVGVVRRLQRVGSNVSSVGIQTLARDARCHELAVAGTPSRKGTLERALLIDPEDGVDGMRVVLPAATFDLRESYELGLDGRRALLSPVELLESGVDYQLGRFRLRLST